MTFGQNSVTYKLNLPFLKWSIGNRIDTRTTRCRSAGHSDKENQKNVYKKLFTTDPLGAAFTESCTCTEILWNFLHFDWLRSQCLLELPQSYVALSDSVLFQFRESAALIDLTYRTLNAITLHLKNIKFYRNWN